MLLRLLALQRWEPAILAEQGKTASGLWQECLYLLATVVGCRVVCLSFRKCYLSVVSVLVLA